MNENGNSTEILQSDESIFDSSSNITSTLNQKHGTVGDIEILESDKNKFVSSSNLNSTQNQKLRKGGGILFKGSHRDKETKSVSFSTVDIRFHEMILGDNPDCKEGPPVQIGWEPYATKRFNLDKFEESRRGERRSGQRALQICPLHRHQIVRQGVQSEAIWKRMEEMEKIKNQRARSAAGYKWKQKFRLRGNWGN